MEIHDLIAGVAIGIGLIGIVVVLIPGLPLVGLTVVLWAFEEGSALAIAVAVLAVVVTIAATVLKYQRPGRRLREAGVSRSELILALLAGVIGFFVIPVIGGPLAFVVGLYLFQRMRVGKDRAGQATRAALRAIALSIGIELGGGFVIAAVWFVAALLG